MKLKIVTFLFLFSTLLSPLVAQQWIYPELKNLNTDVTVFYDVIYERNLTSKEKSSENFIENVTVTVNKEGLLIEKRTYNNPKSNRYMLFDYNKEKLFSCAIFPSGNKGAMIKDFKDPITQVEKKNETKTISGIVADKAIAIVKGEFKDVYYTKSFGLRYCKNFNVDGFLLQYPGYSNALGHYMVIAKTINYNNVDPEIFSLKGFDIFTKEEYENKKIEVSENQHNLELKHVGDKIVKFKAHSLNGDIISNKTINGETSLISFCDFSKTDSYSAKQLPLLNDFKEKNKRKKINYIVIALDESYKLNEFLKTNNINFDVVPNGRWLAEKLEISKYPTNILIDKNGVIQFFQEGYKSDIVDRLNYELSQL